MPSNYKTLQFNPYSMAAPSLGGVTMPNMPQNLQGVNVPNFHGSMPTFGQQVGNLWNNMGTIGSVYGNAANIYGLASNNLSVGAGPELMEGGNIDRENPTLDTGFHQANKANIAAFKASETSSVGGSAASGAASGAAIGSVVPVIGTGIGAAIGGLVGGLSSVFGNKKAEERARKLKAEANESYVEHFEGYNEALARASQHEIAQDRFEALQNRYRGVPSSLYV